MRAARPIGDAGRFQGAAPGAQLYAADVCCGKPTGRAVDAIAAALGWLDANQVAVVNISLVGPDNMVLRQLVRQMIARGHILVAAVGNDGPAAPKDAIGCGHTGAKRMKTAHFRSAVAATENLSLTASGNSGSGRPRARLVTQAPPLP